VLRPFLFLTTLSGLLLTSSPGSLAAEFSSERLLPDETVGYVSIRDVDDLRKHFDETQIGQLMADPVMKPFAEDIKRQFQERWSKIGDRLGLTIDDLRGVASGEIAVAMLRPARDRVATVLLADVGGRLEEANQMLDKVEKRSKISDEELPGLPGVRLVMIDLPKAEELGFDRPFGSEQEEPAEPAEPRRAIYFLERSGVLGVTDDVRLIGDFLRRIGGAAGDDKLLTDVPAYRQVMERIARDAGRKDAQIRWFISPIAYGEGLRLYSTAARRRGKDILALIRDQGFTAIQGVGGYLDFAVEDFELIHRTAVFAPKPYTQAMRMLKFPNRTDFTPHPWVPRELATYSTFYVDIQNAFDNFGSLFDALFGGATFLFAVEQSHAGALQGGEVPPAIRDELAEFEYELPAELPVKEKIPGEAWQFEQGRDVFMARRAGGELRVYQLQTGLWEDVLKSLREDPHGPQLDLKTDLVDHLGPRVSVLTDYQLPITPTSERLLFAIEASEPEQVARAIAKSMKNDPTAKRREVHGYEVWEMVEEEAETGAPDVSFGEIPSLPPLEDPLGQPQGRDGDEEEEEEERLLPHAAVAVAHGHLLVASHLDFLDKILDPKGAERPLADDIDYRIVQQKIIQPFGIEQRCAQTFSRTDEEYRPTYELIRQGKMPESETLLARLLNSTMSTGQRNVAREQKIDGSKLPDYEVVRRYLGPAGAVVTSEEDGWFAKGAILTKGG